MKGQKSRFWTVVVTPTCYAGSVDDNDNVFLWTEVPNACPRNGTSFLRSIQVLDLDDTDADIELYFAQTKDADATVTGALGAATAITNMTDIEVTTLNPLGMHTMPDVSHNEIADYTNSMFFLMNRALGAQTVNIPIFSNEATLDQIEAGTANPGSIYVMGVATATKTYSASGLKYYFTFES